MVLDQWKWILKLDDWFEGWMEVVDTSHFAATSSASTSTGHRHQLSYHSLRHWHIHFSAPVKCGLNFFAVAERTTTKFPSWHSFSSSLVLSLSVSLWDGYDVWLPPWILVAIGQVVNTYIPTHVRQWVCSGGKRERGGTEAGMFMPSQLFAWIRVKRMRSHIPPSTIALWWLFLYST